MAERARQTEEDAKTVERRKQVAEAITVIQAFGRAYFQRKESRPKKSGNKKKKTQ